MAFGRLHPWLLVGLLLSAWDGQAVAQERSVLFVESYAGPHADEFQEVLGEVKSIVPAALAYITHQWGLPDTLRFPLVVRILDTPSKDLNRPISAYVRSIHSGDELRQELVVDLEHHRMYPEENFENVIYHEMAHAVLQDAVTGPGAAGIHQWFNEGLAQSVTTEGHDRTVEDFKLYAHTDAHAVLCDLNGNVDEFYHGEYNFGCYTYFYLTTQYVMERGGKDALAKIILDLRNGTPLPLAIGQVTQMDWPTFQRNAQQYTRDVFDGKQPIP
jgi:hypothetical protein